MAPVSTPPIEQARSIFTDLGYAVSGDDGGEFRAERKWRSVRVTAMADSDETPDDGDMRCFVTWEEYASELRRRLRHLDPEYEWAIIGVRECGDYEVTRAPPSVAPAV
ncbi:hypothetical protein NGM10_15155 [Halorussus salilacus]|uniref:DUF7116 family protein n=1 Tax=Halorussus salilacus TaxID=2953750 RepID=UPI0020A13479|nr:hypothetical protein [Halorussus salilacus]USZ68058.1 hypothetical protein NGM10_15155 [Halorussus salilacus]